MKKKNQGFTLIELIIVVSILAILIGILAPQYTKYVEKSRRAACDANISTLIKQYELAAMEESPGSLEGATNILEKIMGTDGGGGNSQSLDNGGIYPGFCKSKGKYSCLLSENFQHVSIKCSVHGELNIDIKTLKERIESISFGDIPDWTSNYKTLNDYFNNGSRVSIDSEAKSTETSAYGKYGSLAKAVTAKLEEQGINVGNRSWRMYKKGDAYNLFLVDRQITEDDAKSSTWITCEKYDITNEKVIKGKVQVQLTTINGSTYPIIKGESFVEDK